MARLQCRMKLFGGLDAVDGCGEEVQSLDTRAREVQDLIPGAVYSVL